MRLLLDAIHRPAFWAVSDLGLNEAIILEELCFRQDRAVKKIGKFKWFFTPTRSIIASKNNGPFPPLQIRFPWLSEKGIHKILIKLKRLKLIRIDCFNKKDYDRTLWFHVSTEVVRRVKAGHKIQLSRDDAVSYGPSAALVLNYIRYGMRRIECDSLRINPERIRHYVPLSESTIRRALKKLIESGELKKQPNEPVYLLGSANPLERSVCGKAERKFTYYNETTKGQLSEVLVYHGNRLNDQGEKVPFEEHYFKNDRSAYTPDDMGELNELKREIIEAFVGLTDRELDSITPEDERFFVEAALICRKNNFDGTEYVHAQYEDRFDPDQWMPELLVRDDAEQRFLAAQEVEIVSPREEAKVRRHRLEFCKAMEKLKPQRNCPIKTVVTSKKVEFEQTVSPAKALRVDELEQYYYTALSNDFESYYLLHGLGMKAHSLEMTPAEAVDAVVDFYKEIGKRPNRKFFLERITSGFVEAQLASSLPPLPQPRDQAGETRT